MQKAILVLSILLFSIGAVWAQSQPISEDFPLLIRGEAGGDGKISHTFYHYIDGQLQPLPAEAFEDFYDGSLSPDGQWFAYRRMPPFLKDLLKTQGHQYGTAWDIALLNMSDGSERSVAVQSETIVKTESNYRGGIKRSLPVWSPDSRALAWTEQDYPAQEASGRRLLVYELDSQETRTLEDNLPEMPYSSDGMPDHLSWGVPGIAVLTSYGDSGAGIKMGLRIYDPQEGLQQRVLVPINESEAYGLNGPFWVGKTPSAAETDVVVAQAFNDQWYQVDSSGEIMPLDTQLKMVSATNANESLQLVWNIYNPEDEGEGYVAAADGNPIVLIDEDFRLKTNSSVFLVAFAPSGQAAAYIHENVLSVWQDGTSTEIVLPDGLRIAEVYWGPSRWQPGPEVSSQTSDGVGG